VLKHIKICKTTGVRKRKRNVPNDSPCTGVCRMIDTTGGQARCISCNRTYDDLEQWFYMSEQARLERMEQLKRESD
jgi:predicted Fe-S protein YdhL (DUF1289 family)